MPSLYINAPEKFNSVSSDLCSESLSTKFNSNNLFSMSLSNGTSSSESSITLTVNMALFAPSSETVTIVSPALYSAFIFPFSTVIKLLSSV